MVSSRSRRSLPLAIPILGGLLLVAAVVVVAVLGIRQRDVVHVGGRDIHLTAQQARGAELFGHSCANCHTLIASGATATVGPDLDYVQPRAAQVLSVLRTGAQSPSATMPAGLYSGQSARDVAAYVSRVASRAACCSR